MAFCCFIETSIILMYFLMKINKFVKPMATLSFNANKNNWWFTINKQLFIQKSDQKHCHSFWWQSYVYPKNWKIFQVAKSRSEIMYGSCKVHKNILIAVHLSSKFYYIFASLYIQTFKASRVCFKTINLW